MKHFVITKAGVARIMEAVDSVDDPMDVIAQWHPDDRAQVTSARAIDEADIPKIKRVAFRDAWEDDGAKITVSMAKARVNVTDEFRLERNRRLPALDIAYQRADEAGDDLGKRRIAGVKQALRDIPATIQPDLAAITTPEALEAYEPPWPE